MPRKKEDDEKSSVKYRSARRLKNNAATNKPRVRTKKVTREDGSTKTTRKNTVTGSKVTRVKKADGDIIVRRKSKTGNLKSITEITGSKKEGTRRKTTYNKNTEAVKMARAVQRSRKRIKAGETVEQVGTGAAARVAANQLKRRKAMKAGKENRTSRLTRAIKRGKEQLRKQTRAKRKK